MTERIIPSQRARRAFLRRFALLFILKDLALRRIKSGPCEGYVTMFRNGNRVRIKDSVFRKVRIAAEMVGCTLEEFVERAAEKEAEKALSLMSRREPGPSVESDLAAEPREIL